MGNHAPLRRGAQVPAVGYRHEAYRVDLVQVFGPNENIPLHVVDHSGVVALDVRCQGVWLTIVLGRTNDCVGNRLVTVRQWLYRVGDMEVACALGLGKARWREWAQRVADLFIQPRRRRETLDLEFEQCLAPCGSACRQGQGVEQAPGDVADTFLLLLQ